MSETDKDKISEQNVDLIITEAKRLLDEIGQFRIQAEEQFKAAELSRKNADSEGLFAVNAKKVCEEHATAISQLKGNLESEANAIRSNKLQSDEFLAALTAGKATIEADAKMIGERRKEADLSASSIEAVKENCVLRGQEVEKSKAIADESLKTIVASREAADLAQKGAETSQGKVDGYSANAQKLVNEITDVHTTSNELFIEIQKALNNAENGEAEIVTVLEHLKKSDDISVGYEKKVAELTKELEQLLIRVDALLPGAASASLASSFNAQKKRFAKPQKHWFWTFIGCIVSLVVVALPSFLDALGLKWFAHVETDIWKNFMLRMPIVIPLVWLAIYAGRNYMLSLRLEEEYAYKEAVSTAFEGYKREMTGIEVGEVANPSPVIKLCANILAAIAERPGRIYEGKHKDITILNESHGAAQKVADLAKKKITAG